MDKSANSYLGVTFKKLINRSKMYSQPRLIVLTGKWSKLKATITFRRKTSAFIPAMYFPCTVIVIVSWITFFINPDHFPARTNLCAVSVLTIITLQGGMSNTLPKVKYHHFAQRNRILRRCPYYVH